MKKLLIIVVMLCIAIAFPRIAKAESALDYTFTLSTEAIAAQSPAEWTRQSGLTWPMVSGNGRICHIILTNSGATAQTVTFYDLTTTTSTLTEILTIVVASTGTTVVPMDRDSRINQGYTTGLIIKKSAAATVVEATILVK